MAKKVQSSKKVNTKGYDPYNKPATKNFAPPKKTNYNDPYNNAGPKIKATSRPSVPVFIGGVAKNSGKAGLRAELRAIQMSDNARPAAAFNEARAGMDRKNKARASQVRAAAAVRKASAASAVKLPKVGKGRVGAVLFAAGATGAYVGSKMEESKKKKKK